MGFFKALFSFLGFGKDEDVVVEVKKVASDKVRLGNSELFFNPQLVKELKEEHQLLVNYYTGVAKARETKNLNLLKDNLSNFVTSLEKHLLKENTYLYVYLFEALRSNPQALEKAHEMKRDMSKIGHAVLTFVDKYRNNENWNDSTLNELEKDMEGITPVLVKRIETEETVLYPLYKHPEQYK